MKIINVQYSLYDMLLDFNKYHDEEENINNVLKEIFDNKQNHESESNLVEMTDCIKFMLNL